jgi:hypothetical protein
MRLIKLRYRLKNTSPVTINGVYPGDVVTEILTLEDIEGSHYTSMLLSYPVLSRDQFTGLLDKEEKEIYENDIVIDEKMGISTVSFFNASFVVSEAHFVIGKVRASKMKVIGNIHENTILLNRKESL